MKPALFSLALCLVSTLAACGPGGGVSTTPLPVVSPSTTPASSKHIVFSITGLGQSAQSNGRAALATNTVVQEPVEVGIQPCLAQTIVCASNPLEGAGAQFASITPRVVDANGAVVTETTLPTVTVTDATMATAHVSTLSPPIQLTALTTVGQTSVSVTYPDASGTLPVDIYPQVELEWLASGKYDVTEPNAGPGFNFGSGSPVANATGDMSLDSAATLHMPYGAVILSSATPISQVLDCATSFTGTTVTSVSLASLSSSSTKSAIILARTSVTGVCVKLRWATISQQSAADWISGIYLISNANGTFAY